VTVTAPAPAASVPVVPTPHARRRRYTADQVGIAAVLWRMAAGLVVLLIFVAPYVLMFLSSLKSKSEILRVPATFLPEEWHPENYFTMWSSPETPLVQNLVSTIVIAVFATLLVLAVALPAAYYTARFRFPGRMVFLFLVIGDTWLAMILINAAFNLSFAVWIMHSFFAGVPKEIDEAAQLDGAGRWAVLVRINLPLVWPGIVTAIVFTFVACWNEFAASLVILSTAGNQPLSVALTKFVGQYATSWQYVFGVSIVAIVPVVILFLLIEKRLVGGLTAGSVK
jgi:multiple sugar transport system permease protein